MKQNDDSMLASSKSAKISSRQLPSGIQLVKWIFIALATAFAGIGSLLGSPIAALVLVCGVAFSMMLKIRDATTRNTFIMLQKN